MLHCWWSSQPLTCCLQFGCILSIPTIPSCKRMSRTYGRLSGQKLLSPYRLRSSRLSSWHSMREDALNPLPPGSVPNQDWRTLKDLTIWPNSTCAHSARLLSEPFRKEGYSVENAEDTSRVVCPK